MKKIMLPLAIVVVLAIAVGWFYFRGHHDNFDYEATFDKPAASADGGVATLIDLKAIAGKDKNAVRDALGEPSSCEPAEFSERCRYGSAQITYIAGKADWITVSMGGDAQPLLPETLAVLGLPVRDPDEVNEHENIWRDLGGYREVRLVGSDQGAMYARIKVATL